MEKKKKVTMTENVVSLRRFEYKKRRTLRKENPRVSRVLEAFLESRSSQTRRAYRGDFKTLARFLNTNTIEAAIEQVVEADSGDLNAIAIEYRTFLARLDLSPSTINRRLASLRSILKHARILGFNTAQVAIPNVKSEQYRDTRGPGRKGFLRMLEALEDKDDRKSVRDRALLRLLYDVALRRGEIVSLNIDDIDLEQGLLNVLGKGRTQRKQLSLPTPTLNAVRAWMAIRGCQDHGPLFVSVDTASKGTRLSGRSIYRIVRTIGKQCGIRVTPHGLRHAAITAALDLTNGDVRAVQRFSRHKDIRVLNVYDDCRQDLAGRVAKLVASGCRRMLGNDNAAFQMQESVS